MSTSYHPISPILTTSGGFAQNISALSFDPVSDILWAGSDSGTVTAYIGTRGVRGPSFPVGGNLPTKKILAGDNYVHAVGNSNEGLGSWTKGGVNKWFFRHSSDIVTFSNTPPASTVMAASLLSLGMIFLSPMTGTIVRQVQTASVLTQLELSHSILLSGSSDGYLRVHDPRTGMGRGGRAENIVKAHARSVQGLQSTGNFVFTIGMGERQSRPFPDPLVKVYDLRSMRSLPPVPFPAVPSFIHSLPNRTSSLMIASNQGLINIVDISNPSASNEFYQLDVTSCITSTSISPNAIYMAFGDAEGTIHLLSQAETDAPFNGFDGQPIPWADTPAPLPDIGWTEATPLNIVGMPYFDTQLLSAWPTKLSSRTIHYPPPARIPPQVLASMKFNDDIAYATLPKELRGRRNIVAPTPRKGVARFRSEKAGEPEPDSATLDHSGEAPRMYRRVEIEYSKFGVEDFDFGFYNKTEYSGLETHILNSYTNSMVQVMHYVLPIRHLAKSHITIDCTLEHCLFCELGFISRMLEDARGTNCQASNFCKTVGVLAQGIHAIEIIDYGRESAETDYAQKMQTFHRFLIDHLTTERSWPSDSPLILKSLHLPPNVPPPPPITQLLGITGKSVVTCTNCRRVREKTTLSHVVDMIYPSKPTGAEATSLDFASILRSSLFREITHRANCQICKHFSTLISRRAISSQQLPPILAVNASVYSDESFSFWQDWRTSTFLQPRISLRGELDGADDPEEIAYDVRALVIKITGKDRKSHLVAIIKVPGADRDDGSSSWFLFNDFVVTNISQAEALGFPDRWKVPAVIYLERPDMHGMLDFSGLLSDLDQSILSRDTSISSNRDTALIKHRLLNLDELPKPGSLVAIDAEFVSMQQEETEFRSDGTKKVLRPARLSLARVSVLRGAGPRAGVPFIDDHIHTSEIIVDYLTEFSGIKFGDLDPSLSLYTLTPLKLVYKKLRCLVDSGCIFIGHGLSKDFRIINIFVPPDQVIDTVDLYFVKARQRRLSLRFLSWYILGEHIQTDTHDSIEDARSALRLYDAYNEFETEGIFDQKLEEIYKEGRQYGFKPPTLPSESTDPPEALPVSTYPFTQATRPNPPRFQNRH